MVGGGVGNGRMTLELKKKRKKKENKRLTKKRQTVAVWIVCVGFAARAT